MRNAHKNHLRRSNRIVKEADYADYYADLYSESVVIHYISFFGSNKF